MEKGGWEVLAPKTQQFCQRGPPRWEPHQGAQHQGAVFLTLGDSLQDGCPTSLHTSHPYEDKVIPGWL